MNKSIPSEGAMQHALMNLRAYCIGAARSATLRVSDEDLDRLGRLYEANNLYSRGVLFETFVRYPAEILFGIAQRHGGEPPEEFLPPLPRQFEAAARAAPRRRTHSRPIEDSDLVFLKRQAD